MTRHSKSMGSPGRRLGRRTTRMAGLALLGGAAVAGGFWPQVATATPLALRSALPAPYADSPYIDTIAPNITSPPAWQQGYDLAFDHDHFVGVHWSFIDVRWSDIQSSATGVIDLSGLDTLVIDAHHWQVNLVFQLDTCAFSAPQPPTGPTGGYRTNSIHRTPTVCAPVNIGAAIPAWQAVVARYMPGGSLAREQGWTDGYGTQFYEIENEADQLDYWGTWEVATKDYALYLQALRPALLSIDPSAHIDGPALNQTDASAPSDGAIPNKGMVWLDNLLNSGPSTLEWASDQYRAAVSAGAPVLGAGPFIDVYSFHEDTTDIVDNIVAQRAAQIRALLSKYSTQAGYPTAASAPLSCSECQPTQYTGKPQYAWAEFQYAMQSLAAGLTRFDFGFATQQSDNDATFSTDASALMGRALLTYFPSNTGVQEISTSITAPPGQALHAYRWTNPSGGAQATALFAQDQAQGSNASGPTFTVSVPVRTAQATVVTSDWASSVVQASGGAVTVTLQSGDPSPPVIVAEIGQPPAASAGGAGRGGARRGPGATLLPDTDRARVEQAAAAAAALLGIGAASAFRRRAARRTDRLRRDGVARCMSYSISMKEGLG